MEIYYVAKICLECACKYRLVRTGSNLPYRTTDRQDAKFLLTCVFGPGTSDGVGCPGLH
jgi:hypothetical protein